MIQLYFLNSNASLDQRRQVKFIGKYKRLAMNKATIAVKKLRQNFIKRNQIDPDFFLFTEDNTDYEEQIASLATANRNVFPIKNTLYRPNADRSHSHTRHHSLASLQKPFHHNFKIVSNPESKIISIKGKAIFSQDKFAHGVQLQRNILTRQGFMQNGRPSVLLNHCSVQAIKIENRPRSAFCSVKNTTIKVSRGSSAKKQNKLRKRSEHLKPWEVEEQQIYTCWI